MESVSEITNQAVIKHQATTDSYRVPANGSDGTSLEDDKPVIAIFALHEQNSISLSNNTRDDCHVKIKSAFENVLPKLPQLIESQRADT